MTVNSTTMTTVKRKLTGAMTALKETISTRICMSTNVCSRTPSGRPTTMPIMDKMIFSRNTYAFGQIDVAEVKQDDERECAGGNEHERDDIV